MLPVGDPADRPDPMPESRSTGMGGALIHHPLAALRSHHNGGETLSSGPPAFGQVLGRDVSRGPARTVLSSSPIRRSVPSEDAVSQMDADSAPTPAVVLRLRSSGHQRRFVACVQSTRRR
jgi:hypothetical protein